jgi:PAS domain-containing protein
VLGPSAALIESIYAAIADDEVYDGLTRLVAHELNASSGWIQEHGGPSVLTIRSQYEFNEQIAVPYQAYFHSIDPWLKAAELAPPNRAMLCERYVAQAEFERSELWNDLCRPQDGAFHCCGIILTCPEGVSVFALHRRRGSPAFDGETEAYLDALAPHMARLARTRRRLSAAGERHRLPQAVLDEMSDALFVVNARGHVLFANAAAKALGGKESAPVRLAGGNLVCGRSRERQLLQAALDASARPGGVSTTFSVELDGGTWDISVDPLVESGAGAVVVVRDRLSHARARANALQSRHGLSEAETRLVAALAEGLSVERYAAVKGVRVSTVRSQLHCIFGKTGAVNQAALVGMTLQSPGR